MKTQVVLGLGGNQGEREKLLSSAIERIKERVKVLKVSSVYETEAWGGVAKGNFLNLVVLISTEFSPLEVLELVQGIEKDLGRTREQPWGDRAMDIDILFFGDEVIENDRLSVPHPFLADRKFVLVPLLEILPEKKHPITGKTPGEMLVECGDESEISVWISKS